MTRYWVETECEHGNVAFCGHRFPTDCQVFGCGDPSHFCPAGSRRELSDSEILAAVLSPEGVETVEVEQTPGMGTGNRKVLIAQEGRYAIVPLPEEGSR